MGGGGGRGKKKKEKKKKGETLSLSDFNALYIYIVYLSVLLDDF